MDGKKPWEEELQADYALSTEAAYVRYSTFFIRHHGPGFFLALMPPRAVVQGLPSWAAEWTARWPNHRAVAGRDLAATTRTPYGKDLGSEVDFDSESGGRTMTIFRRRIRKGYFTRTEHIDDSGGIVLEDAENLGKGEHLVELYPGLAALLDTSGKHYTFDRVCPHALSERGVEELVRRWTSVVMGEEKQEEWVLRGAEYLGSIENFNIR